MDNPHSYRIEEMANSEFRIYRENKRFTSAAERTQYLGCEFSLEAAKKFIRDVEALSNELNKVIAVHEYKV
jgi:hypothetical protein